MSEVSALTPHDLLNRSLDLVSAPIIYVQLSAILQKPLNNIDEISQIIQQDPALSSRLLRIVNSPYYGFPNTINTLSKAITVIGTRELSHLALATSVINSFSGIPDDLVDVPVFWRHSLATAMMAKYLAEQLQIKETEPFFVAGLLHNIGSLVLYQILPEFSREAIRSARFGHEPLHIAEQRIIGFDHGDMGCALAEHWRLPDNLMSVTRYHHRPSETVSDQQMVDIIHIADIIVSAAEFGHAGDPHVPPLDTAAWQRLNISTACLPELIAQIDQQLEEVMSGWVH